MKLFKSPEFTCVLLSVLSGLIYVASNNLYLVGIAGLFVIAALIKPLAYRVHASWMALGELFGKVFSPIFVTGLYCLVVGTLSGLRRIPTWRSSRDPDAVCDDQPIDRVFFERKY